MYSIIFGITFGFTVLGVPIFMLHVAERSTKQISLIKPIERDWKEGDEVRHMVYFFYIKASIKKHTST